MKNKWVDLVVNIVVMVMVVIAITVGLYKVVEVEKLKVENKWLEIVLDLSEDYYWLEAKNNELKNDIYWLKEMHKLELENAKNNDLENRIQELEGFIDNYEDLLEIYFNWLRNNPNGTQEEFELYLFTNHRWLYEWAVEK